MSHCLRLSAPDTTRVTPHVWNVFSALFSVTSDLCPVSKTLNSGTPQMIFFHVDWCRRERMVKGGPYVLNEEVVMNWWENCFISWILQTVKEIRPHWSVHLNCKWKLWPTGPGSCSFSLGEMLISRVWHREVSAGWENFEVRSWWFKGIASHPNWL